MALTRHAPPLGRVQHSDQGSHDRSLLFGRTLVGGDAPSTDSRGDAYDSAVTESIKSTIEAEIVEREVLGSRYLVRLMVFDYIECLRPASWHSTLECFSPIEFEE